MQKLSPTIQLRSITSEEVTPEIFEDLFKFCVATSADKKLDAENWRTDDWENSKHSLLYCLLKEKRFRKDHGQFHMLYSRENLVAVSGVYRSDFAPEAVAIGGVRAYTLPQKRTAGVLEEGRFFHGDYIFPQQIRWAREQGFKKFILTFNDSNLWLAKFILRIGQGRSVLLGYKLSDEAREVYRDFSLYPEKVMIKKVPQYILIKHLEKDHDGICSSSDTSELKNLSLHTS